MTVLDLNRLSAAALADGVQQTRVLFVAINSPGYYSLAIRNLALVTEGSPDLYGRFQVSYVEWDRSEPLASWMAKIMAWRPHILCPSLNIWNRDAIIALCNEVKKILPDTVILVGGQEVTHSVVDYLKQVPAFDYLIDGEGEIPVQQFLATWNAGTGRLRDPYQVSGLRFRKKDRTEFTGPADIVDSLDDIPSPNLAGIVPVQEKRTLGVLIEGSRGCPFRCSYCFEGAKTDKVRNASFSKLEKEITGMVQKGATYFHLLDPILCYGNRQRLARLSRLFEQLRQQNANIAVSVEAYSHLITAETAEYLRHFTIIDIGLQSTCPETLKAIHRPHSMTRFCQGIEYLKQQQAGFNLYLISGLPYETALSFIKGIRIVADQHPTRLFFNELLLLNGTELRMQADHFGYEFDSRPPYTVYSTPWMPGAELQLVQALAKPFELAYNLSFNAIFPTAPWISDYPPPPTAYLPVVLDGPCRHQCAGCARTAASIADFHQSADMLAGDITGRNVEFFTGDTIDIKVLRDLAAQCQLGGASRLKLTCPSVLIADGDGIAQMIHHGIWHFRTFSRPAERHLSTVLKLMANQYSIRGTCRVKPNIEVVLPSDSADGDIVSFVDWASSYGPVTITLPGAQRFDEPEQTALLRKAFNRAAAAGCLLKLPDWILQRVLDKIRDAEQIVDILQSLGLTSQTDDVPPCLLPAKEVMQNGQLTDHRQM
jgi:uncharacterized radical SAM superfamily protein